MSLMRVCVPVADIKSRPESQADLTSQLLFGDEVRVFKRCGDFCSIQALKDDYVGYIAATSLDVLGRELTHYICAPRTFLYAQADMKLPALTALSLGSKIAIIDSVEVRGTPYGLLADGSALFADHLAPLEKRPTDYVSVAETLIRTPYLWGGASSFGIDCSGLVQLALAVTGHAAARDSGEQAQTIGHPLPLDAPLQRGDLVFWRGHVAIMCDAKTLIHANGASMDVRCEAYATAVSRIASHYGLPIAHRRPFL